VTFLGNHDIARFMGEPGATPQKLNLAFALLLTMRGIPQIYAGDEIGMPGGDDPDNRRDFPGGFPGDRRNAFTEAGRTGDEQQIFVQVQTLLHLRRLHPALRRGAYVHIFSDDRTFVYVRDFHSRRKSRVDKESERLFLMMNNADQPRTVEIDIGDTVLSRSRTLTRVWADNDASLNPGPKISATLPPRSLSIYAIQ
jgi:glycosidase